MADKSVLYNANLVANTERGPSESIWGAPGVPGGWIADFIQDFRLGWVTEDDFNPGPNFPGGSFTGSFGKWSIFSTAGGAIADDKSIGGALRFSAGTTANQGITIGSSAGNYQLITSGGVAQQRLAFEARVSLSAGSLANSTQDSFVGLMDNLPPGSQVPITNTAGTLASLTNFIGFHKRGGTVNAADWSFVFGANGQTIQYPTNLVNIVNTVLGSALAVSTYYKLGFVFDMTPSAVPQRISSLVASTNQTAGNLARAAVKIFVNGLQCATFLIPTDITAATFPTGVMAPVFSFMQQSTTAGIFTALDWIRVAQSSQA